MLEGFRSFGIQTQSKPAITINGMISGDSSSEVSLPPLLLLGGFPQTIHMWHRVAPQLTDRFTVVLMEIRGYGQSSKPSDIACYAKSSMSHDCAAVMDSLFPVNTPFYVLAHDRGARVAHKLAVDYPHRVRAAIFLDICPTLGMYEATNVDFAKAYWHWFFLIQPSPLPETLISANPRRFAELCMGAFQPGGIDIFVAEAFEAYVASLADNDTVHAMCQDYRAAATLDMDEAKEDLARGRVIQCPLLVLWSAHGVIAKQFDAIEQWRRVTKEGVVVNGWAVESGHYMPEEVPDEIVAAALRFFSR